ncbi:NAD(P)H-hydrate epimerase [Halapricum sp. CBA1109]|uniref:NAD(P)H-hydrate epimerase n=1 Tax=Halapricum sp. CBA1109 TaxID=2668068 RepID=UPI0012FBCD3C|nr:NAD(P)H-hydrate epimerase [Halapricum sp. CBA1109]MUV88540.1 NAD(P)H-hydrate epimerase [Halapricum sp. CBA1109]
MQTDTFQTPNGDSVTAVTAAEMRAVDRVAVGEFGLGLLQMMENAGRNLAWHVRDLGAGPVTVLAGSGGNGGGGLCCARHLANRGVRVSVVLDRDPEALDGAARTQYETLRAMGVPVESGPDTLDDRPGTVVDALVGYGLEGALRGTAASLADAIGDAPTVSLDVPSGLDATTGDRSGPVVRPDRVVTLALPKTGLAGLDADLFLADIAIPAGVYDALDIPYASPFADEYWIELDAL